MDRDRALPLALALLAIVSLALAAATLDSAVVAEGGSGLGGGEGGFGDERRPATDPGFGPASDGNESGALATPFDTCWPTVREPPVLVGLGLVFLGLFTAVYRSTRSVLAGAVVCGGVSIPVGLVWAALAYCAPPPAAAGGRNATGFGARNWSEGGAGGLGGGGAGTLSTPAILLLVLVGLALVVLAVAVLVGRDGDDADGDADPDEAPPEDAAAAVGRAAGAAADRIDDGATDPGNEVYRAWREMTASLDVESPETTTPREFQRAAVDAGMAREDVAALTSLFEAVRYGGREPTAATERRAVETLRRIEAGYGGE